MWYNFKKSSRKNFYRRFFYPIWEITFAFSFRVIYNPRVLDWLSHIQIQHSLDSHETYPNTYQTICFCYLWSDQNKLYHLQDTSRYKHL